MNFKVGNITSKYQTDILRLIKWLILLTIFIYSPFKVLSTLILIIVLILFYNAKNEDDFFWIVVVFSVVDYVGNLFYGVDRGFIKISNLQFDYLVIFSIVALAKVINKRNKYSHFPHFLKTPYLIYLVYFLFLLFYGISIYGLEGGGETGFRHYYNTFRIVAMIPIFYSLSIIFSNVNWLPRFSNLLFVLLIFNFVIQLASIFFPNNIHFILGGDIPEDTEVLFYSDGLTRAIFGSFINLISLLLAIYYLYQDKKYFSRNYLIFVIAVAYISIFFTASRTWIIGYTIFLLLVIITSINSKRYKKIVFKFAIVGISIFILIVSYSGIKYQTDAVISRINTLELLFEGDLTAGGTNARFTSRPERVIAKFDERPIIGWGISNVSFEYWDGHVGNQSIMLVGGIAGIIVFSLIWILIIYQLLREIIKSKYLSIKYSLLAVLLFFLLTLIIHSGTQRYGFIIWGLSPTTAFITAIWMSIIANIYQHSKAQYTT